MRQKLSINLESDISPYDIKNATPSALKNKIIKTFIKQNN